MKNNLLNKLLSLTLLIMGGAFLNPAWAQSDYSTDYTGNVTLLTSGGTSTTACTISINNEDYAGIKAGTSKVAGAVKITVPSGTKYLHLHAAAWNGENVSLAVTPSGYSENISLTYDDKVSGSGNTYVLTNSNASTSYYKVITFASALAENTDLTFTATGGKRFVIWGVTAEEEGDDGSVTTTTTIDDSGIKNTNMYVSKDAGSFRATVKDESDKEVDGATVTWTSSNTDVAIINSSGEVTLVAAGTTTITASYAGEEDKYKSSSDTYEMTVKNEDPDLVTIWSENFSTPSYSDRSTTYGYVVTGSSAVQSSDNFAGGASPEMMVKSSGTFSATIALLMPTYGYGYSGDLTLTFKSNAKSITVKSGTSGITVNDEASVGAGVEFTTKETHEVIFKGVTSATEDITIIFSAEGGENARIDDILLKGKKAALTVVATPVFYPSSGAVVSGQEISITCPTDGASIYYTTDGTDPSSSSTLYNPASKPTVTTASTIKAIGIKDGLTNSAVAEASYTIAAPCATPSFSVAEGEVEKGTPVTITCATDGATIYYTTDGTEPTTSSSTYESPLTINNSQTIKAFAAKEGLANSEVASVVYSVKDYSTLPFEWPGGTSSDLNNVTGVTTSGLGDYAASNAPYRIKMDGTDDFIQVKTDTKPGKVYVGVKMLGGNSTSNIKVQESADGTNFTDVEELTISGSQNDIHDFETSKSFAATTRYVKIIMSKKGSNIGVGPITITGCEIVTIGPANYTTYTTTGKVCFPEGVTGYIATATTTSTVELTSKNSVPASTPIVLKASAGTYYLPVITTDPDNVSRNILQASDGSVKGDGSTIYALGVGKTGDSTGKVGFYLVGENVVIPAGKAYLNLGGSPAKEFLTFDFSETPDGIKTLSQTPVKEEGIYNLSGQRLNKMQKGINIVNGKKVLY